VDLKLSIRHVHHPGRLLTFHCQVKSGRSFCAASSTPTVITLRNVGADMLTALGQGTRPALLLWVPTKPSSRVYWHILQARTVEKTPVRIQRINHVTPTLRYDLCKASSYFHTRPIAPRLDVANMTDQVATERARDAYAELQSRSWKHPLAGSLAVTRFAWRHVTRRSKPSRQRIQSLRAVPYLKDFLEQMPTRYLVANRTWVSSGKNIIESRDVICWYKNALRIAGLPHTLLLRIREEISYPVNWSKYPLGVADVLHSAKLVSWWCKP